VFQLFWKTDDNLLGGKLMITQFLKTKARGTAVMITLTSLLGLTACGDNGGGNNIEIPGVDGPTIELSEENLKITMIFENVAFDGGIRYGIPKYPSSWLEVAPDLQSAGSIMTMTLAIDDVLDDDLLLLDPQKLPGGRDLPGVRGGSLPAVAFSIENFNNMSFYVGPEVFGFFVPAGVDFDNGIATFRYFIGDDRAGNISIVGKDQNGENAGLLLLLDMDSSTKKKLRRYARRF